MDTDTTRAVSTVLSPQKPEEVFGEGSTFSRRVGRPLGPPPAAEVPKEETEGPKGFEYEAAKTRNTSEQARQRKLERDVSFRMQAKQVCTPSALSLLAAVPRGK